jgi:hypothetical protein
LSAEINEIEGIDWRGWSRKWMADGFILFPPQGRSAGGIRVQDRLRPLRAVRTIVDQALLEMQRVLGDLEVGPMTRLVTVEGEYGAALTITGKRRADGQRVERTLGLVFSEDSYSRIDGIMQVDAELEGFRARVRAMARNLSLGLGAARRRRFLYRPPLAWQGMARTFRSDWIPPEYPRDHAMIQVFHAKPFAAGPQVAFERMLREDLAYGLRIEDQVPPTAISNPYDLPGEVSTVVGRYPDGPRLHFDLAVLIDARFLYILRLMSGDEGLDSHRAAFRSVVESVQPLPAPREARDAAPVDLHWAT